MRIYTEKETLVAEIIENNITGGANKCRILVLKEFAIV